jgi:hypothetical protein
MGSCPTSPRYKAVSSCNPIICSYFFGIWCRKGAGFNFKHWEAMILLNDSPWGDFPTWMLAIIALITFIISLSTLFQQKKIQELSDIVVELQKQTVELKNQSEVHAKRYELEKKISLKDRMPYFRKNHFRKTGEGSFSLFIINDGIEAFDLTWGYASEPVIERGYEIFKMFDGKNVAKGVVVSFIIKYGQDPSEKEAGFVFFIGYSDSVGNPYIQKILCDNGKIHKRI